MVETYFLIFISNYALLLLLYTDFIGKTAGFVIKCKNWGVYTYANNSSKLLPLYVN